jgi:hypothetical protein
MNARALWIRTVGVVVLAWFCFVPVHAAGDDPPNTGMADPSALANAFDRFAAGGAPANIATTPQDPSFGVDFKQPPRSFLYRWQS